MLGNMLHLPSSPVYYWMCINAETSAQEFLLSRACLLTRLEGHAPSHTSDSYTIKVNHKKIEFLQFETKLSDDWYPPSEKRAVLDSDLFLTSRQTMLSPPFSLSSLSIHWVEPAVKHRRVISHERQEVELVGCIYTRKLNMPSVVHGTDANWHGTADIHTSTLQHRAAASKVPTGMACANSWTTLGNRLGAFKLAWVKGRQPRDH